MKGHQQKTQKHQFFALETIWPFLGVFIYEGLAKPLELQLIQQTESLQASRDRHKSFCIFASSTGSNRESYFKGTVRTCHIASSSVYRCFLFLAFATCHLYPSQFDTICHFPGWQRNKEHLYSGLLFKFSIQWYRNDWLQVNPALNTSDLTRKYYCRGSILSSQTKSCF